MFTCRVLERMVQTLLGREKVSSSLLEIQKCCDKSTLFSGTMLRNDLALEADMHLVTFVGANCVLSEQHGICVTPGLF